MSTSLVEQKVDILLPCYNSSGTLYRTLDSIRRQTFKKFRVIMIDNNSNDDSVDILESFQDDRFESVRYGSTVPLGDNFNRCLEHVKADYYCIMHADDEYQKDYLEVMLAAMDGCPSALLACCNASIIDENSKERLSVKNLIKKNMSASHEAGYAGCNGLAWISEYNKIVAPTVMYRRAAINSVGKYNPDLKFTLDWEYYFRTLKSGSMILHVDKVLFNYRIHTKQQTAALIASMDKYYEMYSLLNDIHNYIYENCKAVKLNKFRYFIYTILADLFSDVVSLKFLYASKKIRFLVGLIGGNGK